MSGFLANKEELLTGFCFGFSYLLYLGVGYAVLGGIITALLWRAGGEYKKAYRRFGVPLVLLPIILATREYQFLITMVMWVGVLSLGYGIPDKTDAGSWLGRFMWSKIQNKTEDDASVSVRLVLAVLFWVSFFPMFAIDQQYFLLSGGLFLVANVIAYIIAKEL